ncbi:NlpC/P60 family protein [Streptomyces canus]|uniref:NlpC/P60 family protein n=1 Tax=Streptomyces canus TaxID=58343 RepID=UPI002B1DC376|nr:NlpC/P60 family protein [Streptomyces canus]
MAPDRTSRNGGFSLPAKRNSALATAAIASAALLSQTGNAAADEAPSHDEVSRRVTNLYDRAETDSGTYNATRAAGTASSTRGRTGPASGGGRRTGGGDPNLDDIAKQWYGMARAKTGPMIEATLPSDRVAARPAETRRRPPSDAPPAREPKPAERALPELTAAPTLALPSAPETAPAALTAAPAQSPSWAPEPASQNLTGTGEMPALGSPQLITGVPEYSPQPVTGVPEYTTQPVAGVPEYSVQTTTGFPDYTPQQAVAIPDYAPQPAAGVPDYTTQPAIGFPEYTPQVSAGYPKYSPQFSTGFPDHTGQLGTGLPEYTAQTTTGFTDYGGQLGTRIPEYAAQATAGFPEYTSQTTPAFAEYSAQPTAAYPEYSTPLTAPLAAIAPPPADTVQTVPAAVRSIPAPRAPEPDWQAPQPAAAPSADLPTVDPGYDSKVIQVLAFARSQIGKPCVWGAAGPGSYDNSGLTQAAWKVAGVSLPRTALGQASTGTAVSLYALQPGDLVFFHDDFSHVGLCTGNGMMIHAPGPGASIREESIYPTGESIIRGAIRPV